VANIIVSNPPYIPLRDADTLHINVRDNEPALALFVPNNDALVFYRAIAILGKTHLATGGHIYCELDAAHADECRRLFAAEGYTNVIVRKDMHGNNRMLRASR
jgi:release factor glutamine methyltransferase